MKQYDTKKRVCTLTETLNARSRGAIWHLHEIAGKIAPQIAAEIAPCERALRKQTLEIRLKRRIPWNDPAASVQVQQKDVSLDCCTHSSTITTGHLTDNNIFICKATDLKISKRITVLHNFPFFFLVKRTFTYVRQQHFLIKMCPSCTSRFLIHLQVIVIRIYGLCCEFW